MTDQQIRIRSLEEYKILLAEVSQNEDPSAGFFLEWMWYYLLTSEISPCPVSGHEFDWAKVQPYYKTLELSERILFTPEIIANLLKRPRYSKKVKFWPSLGLPSFF